MIDQTTTASPAATGVLLILCVVIVIMVRRGRATGATAGLVKGERARPIGITMLDPLLSVIVIGSVAAHLVTLGATHVIVAIVGGIAGVAIGVARAKVMYVRRIPGSNNIVLRRSAIEYGLLLLLVVLRTVEGSIEHSSASWASLVLTSLVYLALVEAIVRAGIIVYRFLRDASSLSAGEI